ncbi:MAG: 2-amino-4-hydroxy-6-hydroxymethyldihydropteridine diphosphokinase [Alphaproteobacteria bacterium]|nr:2-amino-4-hydroxy-6-hydroxymethyldihydropteridine diphosphokinase [Alphaproteobacteria bacterium]
MTSALIGLGGNLGDRRSALRAALAALSTIGRVTDASPVYETAPRHVTDQPAFLNMAAALETALLPLDLLHALKGIERDLGREPGPRFGPRLLDLDILMYGDAVLDLPALRVPHPRIAEREFVLRPLADIAPRRLHPALGRTVAELLAGLGEDQGVVQVATAP